MVSDGFKTFQVNRKNFLEIHQFGEYINKLSHIKIPSWSETNIKDPKFFSISFFYHNERSLSTKNTSLSSSIVFVQSSVKLE